MDSNRRGTLIIGLLLLIVGAWFLAAQYFPQLNHFMRIETQWPLFVVGLGLFFLILAVLLRSPGMAVPASILGGIGGLLYYQNQSGNWESWAYAWTLIPGFVGFGVLLNHLLEGRLWEGIKSGLGLMLFSLFLFGAFSSFLGGPQILAKIWPLYLIAAGIWLLIRGARRKRDTKTSDLAES